MKASVLGLVSKIVMSVSVDVGLSKGTLTNGLRIDTTQGKKCHALLQYIYEAICTIANECNLLEHIVLGGNYDISLTCLCTWYDEF